MFKFLTFILVLTLTSYAYSEELIGTWAFDQRHGYSSTKKDFEIEKDKIYWNWESDNFQCSAKYRQVYSGSGLASPYNLSDAKNRSAQNYDLRYSMLEISEEICNGESIKLFPVEGYPYYIQFTVWPFPGCPDNLYPRAQIVKFSTYSQPSSWSHASNLSAKEASKKMCIQAG